MILAFGVVNCQKIQSGFTVAAIDGSGVIAPPLMRRPKAENPARRRNDAKTACVKMPWIAAINFESYAMRKRNVYGRVKTH